jgi:hypothetical protein
MERQGSGITNALSRPASDGAERLSAWDDYPIHQHPSVLSAVTPSQPNWAERFYFNIIRPSGELAAVIGGGLYPMRGVSESYFCRFEGDRQLNVRAWTPLPRAGEEDAPSPFVLRCDVPLRDWSVAIDLEDAQFRGQFIGAMPPYLYPILDIPSSQPGGEFDLYRHFVALGTWKLEAPAGLDMDTTYTGVRDRTWGVRTRRIRLHNWYVFSLGDACLTLIHQELADGSVFFSEAGAVHTDGRVERLHVAGHDLRYDPDTREVESGRFTLVGDSGALRLEYERVGRGIRLAGAGYDDAQGSRATPSGIERDEYDLADPEVAKRTGRGTIDAGVRARVEGVWEGEGVGVVETALARDHVKYGQQIA